MAVLHSGRFLWKEEWINKDYIWGGGGDINAKYLYYKIELAISGNLPLLVLNAVYIANGAIYGDFHVADWHVPEIAMYDAAQLCS